MSLLEIKGYVLQLFDNTVTDIYSSCFSEIQKDLSTLKHYTIKDGEEILGLVAIGVYYKGKIISEEDYSKKKKRAK